MVDQRLPMRFEGRFEMPLQIYLVYYVAPPGPTSHKKPLRLNHPAYYVCNARFIFRCSWPRRTYVGWVLERAWLQPGRLQGSPSRQRLASKRRLRGLHERNKREHFWPWCVLMEFVSRLATNVDSRPLSHYSLPWHVDGFPTWASHWHYMQSRRCSLLCFSRKGSLEWDRRDCQDPFSWGERDRWGPSRGFLHTLLIASASWSCFRPRILRRRRGCCTHPQQCRQCPEKSQVEFERRFTVSTFIRVCSTALWSSSLYDWSYDEEADGEFSLGFRYHAYDPSLAVNRMCWVQDCESSGVCQSTDPHLLWTMSIQRYWMVSLLPSSKISIAIVVIVSMRAKFFAMFTLRKKLPELFTWPIQKLWKGVIDTRGEYVW